MRGQTGTTSLRAILYMDEIVGYFPPVANPPSKAPLLTLLKQARAFGVGVVLATQNPVDLDYKGLSNTGTWFLGRLQTERDKARVLDGLEGAAGGAMDRGRDGSPAVGARQARVPAAQRARQGAGGVPDALDAVVSARTALPRSDPHADAARASTPAAASAVRPVADSRRSRRRPAGVVAGGRQRRAPVLPPGIQQFFVPAPRAGGGSPAPRYMPVVLGAARVGFARFEARRSTKCATFSMPRRSAMARSRSTGQRRRAGRRHGRDLRDVSRRRARRSRAAAGCRPPAARTTPPGRRISARWLSQSEKHRADAPTRAEADVDSRAKRSATSRVRVAGCAARGARRGRGRGPRQKYSREAAQTRANSCAAPRAAVERETAQASQQKLQTGAVDGRDAARRALRPQDDQHVDPGPRDDGSARSGRQHERGRGRQAGDATTSRRSRSASARSKTKSSRRRRKIAAASDAHRRIERLRSRPSAARCRVQLVGLGWLAD